MRKFCVWTVALLVFASVARGEENFWHKVEWHAYASLPMTYEEGSPNRWQWRERASLGAGVEVPYWDHVAFIIQADKFRFNYLPQYWGGGNSNQFWLADVSLNMKWYFTKRAAILRPFFKTGLGLMWGNLFHSDALVTEGTGYFRHTQIAWQIGLGVSTNMSEHFTIIADGNYLSSADADFFPIKLGFSFRY
jgi:hypothetical protein